MELDGFLTNPSQNPGITPNSHQWRSTQRHVPMTARAHSFLLWPIPAAHRFTQRVVSLRHQYFQGEFQIPKLTPRTSFHTHFFTWKIHNTSLSNISFTSLLPNHHPWFYCTPYALHSPGTRLKLLSKIHTQTMPKNLMTLLIYLLSKRSEQLVHISVERPLNRGILGHERWTLLVPVIAQFIRWLRRLSDVPRRLMKPQSRILILTRQIIPNPGPFFDSPAFYHSIFTYYIHSNLPMFYSTRVLFLYHLFKSTRM